MVRELVARARSLWRGIRRRPAVEAEMAEEFRLHQELRAEDLMRAGLAPAEARRRARLEFGPAELHKDDARAARGLGPIDGLRASWIDVRLAGRMLVKHPGLTVVAVLALSVAIGAGSAYLEFLTDVFRPTLPVPQGERLVGIQRWNVATGESDEHALHDLVAWRAGLRTVEALGAYAPLDRTLITADGRAEPVRGVAITASAFPLVGAPPLLGRPLLADDERPGAPAVVLLGHDLWRTRFAADPAIVGATVRLGRTVHTVVGVMPPGFAFPVNHGLWVPLALDATRHARGEGPALTVFGRLAPGVALGEAQAELSAVGRRAAADFPATHRHLRPIVRPYVQALVSTQRDGPTVMRILYALNLFFVGLLAVCGANVATLVFARTATREGELTVRTALGAGRARLVTQLFVEALVLTSLATAIGLAAVQVGVRWARGIAVAAGAVPPFWWNDRLSPATLLYAGVLTLLAALLVGVVPALRATGPRLQARLRHAAAGGASARFGRLWTGVIVAQVGLTVAFLLVVVTIGWNVRVGRYGAPAVAFPTSEYLTLRLAMDREPDAGTNADAAFATRFEAAYRELERRLAAEPGVTAVTYASGLPGGDHPTLALEVDGVPAPAGGDGVHWVRSAAVDADFFATFDAPIVAGRALGVDDLAPGRAVAIVDQRFVREVLRGRDPIGVRVRRAGIDRPAGLDRSAAGPWVEIVGVARDLTVGDEESAASPMLYRAGMGAAGEAVQVAVRTRGDPGRMAPRLRQLAASVDPALRLDDVRSMRARAERARVGYALFVRLLVVLGAIALLLSTAGIYALMAFTVARRTREIGIRAALGAAPNRVVGAVLSRAARQLATGALVGGVPGSALVAWGAPEVARGGGVLVGLAALAGVAAFMAAVGLLASAVPVRRALRIPPTHALRVDG